MSAEQANSAQRYDVIYVLISGATTSSRAPEIVAGLRDLGFKTVIAIPTPNSARVLAPRDLAMIDGVRVVESYFDADILPRPAHGVVLWAPCSFNSLNKLAQGIADNLALSVAAEAFGRGTPIVVGPSLNQPLMDHPRTRQSIAALESWGAVVVPQEDADSGPRLASTEALLAAVRPFVLNPATNQ